MNTDDKLQEALSKIFGAEGTPIRAGYDLPALLISAIKEMAYAVQHRGSFAWQEETAKALTRAEVILELIEVADCGSIGGYSKKQKHEDRRSIYHRWVFLYNKYKKKCPEALTYHTEFERFFHDAY